ncbi:hypothetical protein SAMN05428937_1258 [Achromobacter sp. MFA1 R4]|nr:hypothetical protein SAMN05428937_1258 [Achromobacter sp. MFA1 R4]
MYRIKVMFRGKPYELEVLLYEREYTIVHFLYEQIKK